MDSPVLSRLARLLGLTVFLAYVLSFSVGADGLDTDGDGINDADELTLGFDPNNSDENANSILDGEEDPDVDGLTTADELYVYGTDPLNSDTDGDTVTDGGEVNSGRDPLVDERPDLAVTGLPMGADQVSFYVDLANLGLSDVVETAGQIDISVDGYTTYSYNWTTLGDQNFLLAGGSTELGYYPLGNGDHVLEACVDTTDTVFESNETNNCFTHNVTVTENESGFSVSAGVDQSITLGSSFSLGTAFAQGYSVNPLTVATIDWGDGSAVETATQVDLDPTIYLQGTHDYSYPETFTVRVCADDGTGMSCDALLLQVAGNEGHGGSTVSSSSSTEDSSTTSDTTETDDGTTEETDETVGTEVDQEIELSSEDCSAMLFDDVSTEDTFYDAICSFWANGVIQGKDEYTFDTQDWIRRDEASKIFTRLYGYVTEAYGETPEAEGMFVDIELEDPLAYYAETAANEGIMDYDTDSTEGEDGDIVDESYFMPHDAMTVGDIANSLEVVDGDSHGQELEDLGYSAEDTMTRGGFVEFLFDLFQ